jgi:hypothetical protein
MEVLLPEAGMIEKEKNETNETFHKTDFGNNNFYDISKKLK